MMDSSELLDRLRRFQPPYTSLCVRYRLWHDRELAQAARTANGGALPEGVVRLPPAIDWRESERLISIWRAKPDLKPNLVRVEYSGGARHGAFGVSVGEDWWSWQPPRQVRSSDEGRAQTWLGHGVEEFLDPAVLPDALRLQPVGGGIVAGRRSVVVDAWPAQSPRGVPRFGAFAERYRFELDAEQAIVLSAHAFIDDQPFQALDALYMRVDTALDPNLFEFRVP